MLRLLSILTISLFISGPALPDSIQGRTYEVFDGRANTTKPARLIIALHGFLGSSSNMQRKTTFNELARKHGFVVAYPDGRRRRWNDGRSPRNRTDDVGFLSGVIDTMVTSGQVLPDQVFISGHSNGGGMAMRMACDRPDLIRGISVVATKAPMNYPCRTGEAVPALFIHGTDDPIAPHSGRPKGSRLGATLSGEGTVSLWKARNRCGPAFQTQTIDAKTDGTSALIKSYTACKAPLRYVLIEGHGHDWPSLKGRTTRLQGPATQEVDAAELSWSFFSQL